MISGLMGRRDQLLMALRWITLMCPRNAFGVAKMVSMSGWPRRKGGLDQQRRRIVHEQALIPNHLARYTGVHTPRAEILYTAGPFESQELAAGETELAGAPGLSRMLGGT